MTHEPIFVPYDRTQHTSEQAALRKIRFIGGSEVGALFDQVNVESPVEDPDDGLVDYEQDGMPVSPYATPFSLWALKTGRIKANARKETPRTIWGRRVEEMIAQQIAENEGWNIRKPSGYYLHPRIDRMGAHLDFETQARGDEEWVPLEIKAVSDMERSKWRNAIGDLVVPMHIQLQVQHEMSVMGKNYAILGVLFGGYDLRLFTIDRDETLISDIEAAISAFWKAVDDEVEFESDPERDAWVISRLYQQIEPNSVLDWTENHEMRGLIARYKELGAMESDIHKQRQVIRTQIMNELGTKEAANLGDAIFKAPLMAAQTYTVVKEPYRTVRIQKPPMRHAGRPLSKQ